MRKYGRFLTSGARHNVKKGKSRRKHSIKFRRIKPHRLTRKRFIRRFKRV